MKNKSKKKVIVFGASGFIGTYLIDELIWQNYQVYASDIDLIGNTFYKKNNIPFYHIDITKKKDFKKINKEIKFDAVVHLAAVQPANISTKNYDPALYIKVNVIGTLNILELCKTLGVKKIIYGCSHRNTQGLWKKNKAIKEIDGISLKYDGEYAMFSISETAAQNCIEHYRAQYGINGIIFRLPPVYGFGPHTEIFKEGKPIKTGFQTFIENAIECKPLEVWGNSQVGRDIIYVKDVVFAIIKAIDSDNAKGLYNISSGKYLTLKEQVKITAKVFWGKRTKQKIIELPEIPLKMDSFLYDNRKAKNDFGWVPHYDFEEMLLDYKKEKDSKKFQFLLEKRRKLLERN